MRKPKPSARGRARLRKVAREIVATAISIRGVAGASLEVAVDLARLTDAVRLVAARFGVPRDRLVGRPVTMCGIPGVILPERQDVRFPPIEKDLDQ